MVTQKRVILILFLLSIPNLFASCSKERRKVIPASFLEVENSDEWLLSARKDSFLQRQKNSLTIMKSGLTSENYLKIIEGEVRAFQKCLNDSGKIIDPAEKQEKYFTTPCYAHSVAVLAFSGYTHNKKLIESGMKAMDAVTHDMAKNWSAGRHGDFYTWPVLFALRMFKPFAEKNRYELWRKNIAAMDPGKFYSAYYKFGNNWNVVNLAGEFLRYKENFTTINYVDSCLKYQLNHFTEYGMYSENGNPFPYDLFSRYYISGMLAEGYSGALYEHYRNLATKGAWMSLFLQSPFGELPTGHRSSHHIWNEAEQCVVFEIFANEYKKRGEHEIAGAFKRAAMLSLSSIANWIRPDGSGFIVKNKYPVEAKHGYENYSAHAPYNMLATSMLALAWLFSDDKIEEMAAPADVGGYVISIHKPFHKIVASAGQSYLEYDTNGDQLYNPTGVLRVHIKGSHPQLGPSDGCASKYSGTGISIATGPCWQNNDGTWTSLAGINQADPLIEILEESTERASFRVTFKIQNKKVDSVKETITVEKGKVTVEDELSGSISPLMRVTWPMLVFNGKSTTELHFMKNTAKLGLEGKKIEFRIIYPENVILTRTGIQYGHRNGIAEPVIAEFNSNKAIYSIEFTD